MRAGLARFREEVVAADPPRLYAQTIRGPLPVRDYWAERGGQRHCRRLVGAIHTRCARHRLAGESRAAVRDLDADARQLVAAARR